MTDPSETYASSRPRKGQLITYCGQLDGRVVERVEGTLCWCRYPNGESLPFIWAFHDGLNALHDWPTKAV